MSKGAFNGLILNDETLHTIESMAEGLPGGFFIYHADGNEEFVYINPQMMKVMGCSTEEEFRRLTGIPLKAWYIPMIWQMWKRESYNKLIVIQI